MPEKLIIFGKLIYELNMKNVFKMFWSADSSVCVCVCVCVYVCVCFKHADHFKRPAASRGEAQH